MGILSRIAEHPRMIGAGLGAAAGIGSSAEPNDMPYGAGLGALAGAGFGAFAKSHLSQVMLQGLWTEAQHAVQAGDMRAVQEIALKAKAAGHDELAESLAGVIQRQTDFAAAQRSGLHRPASGSNPWE